MAPKFPSNNDAAVGPSVAAAALGATRVGTGARFVVASREAERIELCVFPQDDCAREERIEMRRSGERFACEVADFPEGASYGFRAHGVWAPQQALRFNPHKLLLDPLARALVGHTDVQGPLRGHEATDPRRACQLDSAAFVSRGVLSSAASFKWGADRAPRIPWDRTVLYEAHVKGLTQLHSGIPAAARGTFAALGAPPVIEHLLKLGVTSLELLPIGEELTEPALRARGLPNYWGYSPAAYCVPARRFAREGVAAAHDLKQAIANLHAAGIEVILDVVLNHTAELGSDGPTLSFRGLCNRTYYRPQAFGSHDSVTGCGNAMAAESPLVCELWLEVLRYWVREFHVDGFRFDLAATLARTGTGFAEPSAFLTALCTDPLLRCVKLIMEPWDLGAYRLGKFPAACPEWNDRFREATRGFFRGEKTMLAEFASRICGSEDLLGGKRAGPLVSVNYITSHDGFTLADLVRYRTRQNLGNGENNRDGDAGAGNVNYGIEGPSTDPQIEAARARHQRSLMATLWLSLGVPILAAGDELGRTQGGNSNAYCQDNTTSYLNWQQPDVAMLACVQQLAQLRAKYPQLRRSRFLTSADVTWSTLSGAQLSDRDWQSPSEAALAMRVRRPEGDLLCIFNGDALPAVCTLPCAGVIEFDSAEPARVGHACAGALSIAPTSVLVMVLAVNPTAA